MDSRRLFTASCLALVATSMAFSIRADIIPLLKHDFALNDLQMGQIVGPGLWGFAITIIFGGLLVDSLGMSRLMKLAFVGHVLGTLMTIFATGFTTLFVSTLLIGLANGLVEAVTNPLVATLYPESKTKHLNFLHAWWPGGLIIGGVLCYLVTKILGTDSATTTSALIGVAWKVKMALILLPTLGYGYLILGQPFPTTERVATGVSYRQMLGEAVRPLFLCFLVLMMLTAATELGPNQWIGNMLQNLVGIQGILLLIYTAGIMFVGRRFFAGAVVQALSPLGVLTAGSALSALGLWVLSEAHVASTVFVAATLFGVGTTFFWPTMLGVVAERFPKGGALLLGLMGGAGMLFLGYVAVPLMGDLQNRYTLEALPPTVRDRVVTDGRLDQGKLMALEESSPTKSEFVEAKRYSASQTYRRVALVPVFLTFAFGALFFYFRSLGGFRAVRLSRDENVAGLTPAQGGSL